MAFTHLHVHTDYSAFDGIALARDYVQKVASDGQRAAAITDHHNIGGVLALKEHCAEAGIKPIPGCEFYLAYGNRFDQNSVSIPSASMSGDADEVVTGDSKISKYMHITLLARNRVGWKNLVTLHNRAYESFYQKPRIDFEFMREHKDGIIALTGCLGGPLAQPLSLAVHRDKIVQSILGSLRDDLPGEQANAALEAFMAANASDVGQVVESLGLTDERAQFLNSPIPKDAQVKKRRTFVLDVCRRIELLSAQMATDYVAVAQRNFDELVDIYGRENVYVEVMYHGIPGEAEVTAALFDFAARNNAPCVATGDAHYVHEKESVSHDAWLTAGRKGAKLSDPGRYRFSGSGYHVKTEAEMRATSRSAQWQAACDMTAVVADRIDDDVIPDGELRLPAFPVPQGFDSSAQYFESLVWDGARRRFGANIAPEYTQRLHEEIEVINKMGFADYFLITRDAIAWASSDYDADSWIAEHSGKPVPADRPRKVPILCGPGRGSAAGSLVSYCLGIVHIDPIKHGLYFERFLSVDRAGLPDVDSDFESSRRHEVQSYIIKRYGHDHFAQIGTYSGMLSKASIKAAGRVLGLQNVAEALSKAVPEHKSKPVALGDIAKSEGARDFLAVMKKFGDEADSIMEIARGIEARKGSEGKHACGLIISPENLVDLIPLRRPSAEEIKKNHGIDAWITRWEGPELEQFGLLKQDFLAILNLDIISRALELIRQRGEVIDPYDIERIVERNGPDAQAMWDMLASGDTRGIFQLESQGMTELVTRARPQSLSELSAIIALYRPGPMKEGMHTRWANIKAGLETKSYAHFTHDPREEEILAGVLDETQGVICYQEQLMRLSQVIAGFDSSLRNKLQKAVSKKLQKLLDPLRENFIEGGSREFVLPDGTVSPAFQRSTLDILWLTFAASGEYLFNKSHSVAYGDVSLWMGYLKANYRAEFIAASLASLGKGKTSRPKRRGLIQSAQSHGVEVLPPSIVASENRTSVNSDGHVVYGIGEISEVSESVSSAIAAARRGGPFASFHDAVYRILSSGFTVGHSAIAQLICAGAFDQFGPRRGMVTVLRTITKDTPPVVEVPIPDWEWGPVERAARERSALNMVAGESPLIPMAPVISGIRIDGANPPSGVHLAPQYTGQQMVTAGVVSAVQVRPGSRGLFASIDLEGTQGELEVMLWPDDYRRIEAECGIPEVGSIIVVKGMVKVREHESESEGEDGETVTTVVRYTQLTARQVWVVPDLVPAQPSFPPPQSPLSQVFADIDAAVKVRAPQPKQKREPAARKPRAASTTGAKRVTRAKSASRQPVAVSSVGSPAQSDDMGSEWGDDRSQGGDVGEFALSVGDVPPPVAEVVIAPSVVPDPAPAYPVAPPRRMSGGVSVVPVEDVGRLDPSRFAGALNVHPRRDGKWSPMNESVVSAPDAWCREAARAAIRLSFRPVVPLGAEDDDVPSPSASMSWFVLSSPQGDWVLVHILGGDDSAPSELREWVSEKVS